MSETFNYLYDSVSSSIDYWKQDGSIKKTYDGLVWSAQNPKYMKIAWNDYIDKSTKDFKTAVKHDKNRSILAVSILAIGFLYFKFGGKK